MRGSEVERLLEAERITLRRSDQLLGGADIVFATKRGMTVTLHDLSACAIESEMQRTKRLYETNLQSRRKRLAIFVCRSPEARAAATDIQCHSLPFEVSALVVSSLKEAAKAIVHVAEANFEGAARFIDALLSSNSDDGGVVPKRILSALPLDPFALEILLSYADENSLRGLAQLLNEPTSVENLLQATPISREDIEGFHAFLQATCTMPCA